MQIDYVPVLQQLGAVYQLERGSARFADYLDRLASKDHDQLRLPPLVLANPMAKGRSVDRLRQALELDVELVAAEQAAETARLVGGSSGPFRVSLTWIDDAGGGWTNRWVVELGFRQLTPPMDLTPNQLARFWITAPLWSSEEPSREAARLAVRAAIERVAYVIAHGKAETVDALLRQEGVIASRTAAPMEPLSQSDFSAIERVLIPHLSASDPATLIAALFGDEAAASLGHAALGLPAWAGIRWAAESLNRSMK